ncbi:palladin, cytoskeletal associated protein [Homo sapiens]|uniref:Isoform 9 of Palladin n=1 Tax=Homo sapiens TaxID=9606 RepID=Q8WX93-9|nr:palladin isoform 1 [Homo sapiens]AAI44667.1 PALLD protein [Homo sapiens]KAI2536525.1 palladin, cytoskeletal associated protein [Homo sapiens]KAI4027622.1 palladin, cytoskeletal associated protein [Homo sapiens]|eukprot:NP_001159580.1 palladin isoform 1 [Homo sapiens]
MSGTSSHESFYDSLSDMQEESKNTDFFPGLSAFLSQEEINKSLDLARRAIADSETEDFDSEKEISQIFSTSPASLCEHPSHKETKLGEHASRRPQDNRSTPVQPLAEKQTKSISSPVSKRKPAMSPLLTRPSYIRSLRKAEKRGAKTPSTNVKPKTPHQRKGGPQSQLCDKAANLIEELTSIFKAAKPRNRSPNGESSSPDSGYLSPKNQPSALLSASASQSPMEDQGEMEREVKSPGARHCYQDNQDLAVPHNRKSHPQPHSALHFPAAPRFIQKLRSQEVAEGSRVYLECRVTGNPTPRVRWFCEGKELHNTPDIQIHCEGGDLHTLIIAEAFEDDTGRYTCLATNPSGSDTTSAEVFIEGASSTDSDSESLAFKSRAGAMPQAQKKTTSVSLTIGSSSPKTGVTTAVIQPLSVPVQQVHSPTSYLCRPDGTTTAYFPPVFTKELQNTAVAEGQVVVLECRVRGAPPLQVQWFRQGSEIQDSPDFRILQKKPRSTAEPEEICTLVIAETFPEDAGIFTCSARNDYGSATSTAQLVVTSANTENCSYESMGESNNDHFQHFPPPPPILETSSLELASKKPSEIQQVNNPELGLSRAALQMQFNAAERETNGVHPSRGVNGLINGKANSNKSLPTPAVLLSPTKEPPPLLAKPKLGFPKKASRTARIASDEEIQGTKDAVIQDLERKLRFKEDLLNNGQPRLTYEERMARRLLGADSATVFNIQEPEEETANQDIGSPHASVGSPLDGQKEYKVSSCEQRLISEIEYRLERSPVDESGDEVQYGDVPVENGMAPFFEMKLKHYKIFEGMPVTFTCRVAGNPKPKIYWFKDGKQISPKSDHYTIQRDLDGTCSLHTTASTLDDDGNYTIMAANPQGRISCTGRLMVQAVNQRGRSPRSPSGHPHVRRPRSRSRDSGDENEPIQERFFRPHFLQAPGDLTVQEGKLCRMDCKVSGLPTPDLSWQLDGKPVRPDSAHKMLVRENGVHSLIIEPVTSRDAGIYTCIATNRAGQNSFSLELVVAAKEAHKPPVFIEKLQNTGVADGYPVRLECRVLGVPPPQIFWKKENESLTHSTDRVSMHQDNHGYICLLIQGATKEDAGWYTVSAKNEAGIVSCTARLDVYISRH